MLVQHFIRIGGLTFDTKGDHTNFKSKPLQNITLLDEVLFIEIQIDQLKEKQIKADSLQSTETAVQSAVQ